MGFVRQVKLYDLSSNFHLSISLVIVRVKNVCFNFVVIVLCCCFRLVCFLLVERAPAMIFESFLRGFHKSLPGPVRRVKMDIWPFPYGARPAPFRFRGRRDNFKNPYGRRCVEDAAPNSPGVLFKPVARKQPVKDPAGCIRGPPGNRPANGRAPRDSFSTI